MSKEQNRVTNPVFVDGRPAEATSKDELIAKIASTQNEIRDLRDLDIESAGVAGMIEKLEADIAALVKVLDSKK
ncbi:MAG: hypothetical protein GY941_11970 [Planctomycetes bacterium]|nr:hypothetical protein [Planctomycetota bacterium]